MSNSVLRILLIIAIVLPIRCYPDVGGVLDLSIGEINQAMDNGELTSAQLVEVYLARIAAYDKNGPAINSIISINSHALMQARDLDRERAISGPRSLLHGIPFLLKDNINTLDMPTSGGHLALAEFKPASDARIVEKLKQAGALLLAKTNMDDFGAGINGLSTRAGQTKNPYDPGRNPGGSSAGAAAGVAAGFAAFAIGTDTCGSIRIPASFNNLVGFRPARKDGYIAGVMPLYPFQDTVGPLAKTVDDIEIILNEVFDQQPEYINSHPSRYNNANLFSEANLSEPAEIKLGAIREYFSKDKKSIVSQTIEEAFNTLSQSGIAFTDVNLDVFNKYINEYSENASNEFTDGFRRYIESNPDIGFESFDDIFRKGLVYERSRNGFAEALKDKPGKNNTADKQALLKRALSDKINKYMLSKDLDALVYPSISTLPAKIGEEQTGNNCGLGSVSGLPSLTLPLGMTGDGLPVGIEILGPEGSDYKLLSIGKTIERVLQARAIPTTVPPLVRGRPPEFPRVTIDFENILEAGVVLNIYDNTLNFSIKNHSQKMIYALCANTPDFMSIIGCIYTPFVETDSLSLSAGDVARMLSDGIYLSVFSQEYPRGELRKVVVFNNAYFKKFRR